MTQNVLRQVEAAFDSTHVLWVERELRDAVVALGEPIERIGEAPATPAVDVLDLAATLFDQAVNAIDGDREAFFSGLGANNKY